MWLLNDSLKRTVNKTDAILNNENFGYIVLEDNNEVTLYDVDTDKPILTITDDHKIDLLNFGERIPVTRNDILTKKASDGDYLLYVGLEAFVG